MFKLLVYFSVVEVLVLGIQIHVYTLWIKKHYPQIKFNSNFSVYFNYRLNYVLVGRGDIFPAHSVL